MGDPGMHSGLYWKPRRTSRRASRAVVAAAIRGGYRFGGETLKPITATTTAVLYSRGQYANGGALDYFKDSLLTEGFALVAWPADYGSSGVMTNCRQPGDGVVFRRTSARTPQPRSGDQSFDPDGSWTTITPEELARPAA